MAGIYIHIPFCRQACHYCDFHFSTSLKLKKEMINAIKQEIELRKSFLEGHIIETIYFGGGSPTVLSVQDMGLLMDHIEEHFDLSSLKEVTVEANPEDMEKSYLAGLKSIGVNRLSVGIQSFDDEELRFMNRNHTSTQSQKSLDNVMSTGFTDFSVDLIYGSHLCTDEVLQKNLDLCIAYQPTHISAYNLTIEERTVLGSWLKKGLIQDIDTHQGSEQLMYIRGKLKNEGYDHYEISNFAKKGSYALHNTNYWNRTPYLGVGPSAHSFKERVRTWNIAHNANYIKGVSKGENFWEEEVLSDEAIYNEKIMLGLRTMWGVNLSQLSQPYDREYLMVQIKRDSTLQQYLAISDNYLKLNEHGLLYADRIASALFLEDSNTE